MNSTHTLGRDGANWELYDGVPYADRLVARFNEPKAKNALQIASELIGEKVEWRQMTLREYRT